MADKKISDLTAATGVNYTDTVPIVQTGSTKKIAMSLFALRWNATSSKWDANSSKIAGVAAGVADDETPIMAQIGYSYLSMSGNVTLTSADRRFWIFDPNGSARTVTLPTTNVTAGDVYEFTNTSSTYLLTINASGGSQKTNILNGTVRLVALTATPTLPANWRILSAWQDWVSWTPTFNNNGTPAQAVTAVLGSTSTVYGAYMRNNNLFIFKTRIAMAGTGPSAFSYRQELPNSLTISSIQTLGSAAAYRLDGTAYSNQTNTNLYAPTGQASQGYFGIGNLQTATGAMNETIAYNSFFGAGNYFTINGSIPITEWGA